jgi:hypothetical protein
MSAAAAYCDSVSSEQQLPHSTDEMMPVAVVPAASVDLSKLVILECSKKYFKSRDCPLRLAELVSNDNQFKLGFCLCSWQK